MVFLVVILVLSAEALDPCTCAGALGLVAAPVPAIPWGGTGETLLRDGPLTVVADERHRSGLNGAPVHRLRVGQHIR